MHQAKKRIGRWLAAAVVMSWVLAAGAQLAPAAEPSGVGTPAVPGTPATRPADAKDNPHLWQPRVTSVSVFKNGVGFFLREGDVTLRDGWCLGREVPPASFGTLAIFSSQKDHLVDVVGSGPGETVEFDGRDAPNDAATRKARLEACKGIKVQLTYKHDKTDHLAAGKLRSVGAEFVVLEADANNLAVPLEEITRLQVLELPIRAHVVAEGGKPVERTTLGMAYLRKGITWIPEYTLKVLDDETAELSLRGLLVNEAEDLIHCDVNLVVGVPHFVHTDLADPLAAGQVIHTIATAMAPPQLQSQMLNMAPLLRNTAPGVVDQPVAEAGGLGSLANLPKLDGGANVDFTVYTKKDLTVRRGEKAVITLFKHTVKYSHVYRWNLPGAMQHFLAVRNSTDTAFTTGSVMATADGRPLCEDLLTYTPKGGTVEIPITAAINVAQERTDSEDARQLKAYTVSEPSHVYMDLVTLKGKIELRNFEKKAVTVFVTAPVTGKPLEASDDGKISVDPDRLKLTDRAGSISWKLELPPGAAKTLTYKYERYVPSM